MFSKLPNLELLHVVLDFMDIVSSYLRSWYLLSVMVLSCLFLLNYGLQCVSHCYELLYWNILLFASRLSSSDINSDTLTSSNTATTSDISSTQAANPGVSAQPDRSVVTQSFSQ